MIGKRKKNNLLFSLLLYLYISSTGEFLFGAGIQTRAEKAIKKSFEANVQITLKKYRIPHKTKTEIEKKAGQNFFQDHLYYWVIKDQGKIISHALLDNVYGKSMPITFLVVFDKRGKVINSAIVKYRESIGGQVSQKYWQDQFKGKDASSGFEVDEDISGISGATISVHSVAKGIYKLSLLYRKLFLEKVKNRDRETNLEAKNKKNET